MASGCNNAHRCCAATAISTEEAEGEKGGRAAPDSGRPAGWKGEQGGYPATRSIPDAPPPVQVGILLCCLGIFPNPPIRAGLSRPVARRHAAGSGGRRIRSGCRARQGVGNGEGGIRTPEPLRVTRFRVVPFQPGSRTSPYVAEARRVYPGPASRSSRGGRRATFFEESLQLGPGLVGQDPSRHGEAMVQAAV